MISGPWATIRTATSHSINQDSKREETRKSLGFRRTSSNDDCFSYFPEIPTDQEIFLYVDQLTGGFSGKAAAAVDIVGSRCAGKK